MGVIEVLAIIWLAKYVVGREYRASRDHHAAKLSRAHPDWHARKVGRAASRRTLSHWAHELNAWPPFPTFRAAFAEDRMTVKVAAAEAKAAGAKRWRDLSDRLARATAEAEEVRARPAAGAVAADDRAPVPVPQPPADDLAEHLKAPMPDPRLNDAQRQRDLNGQRNLCAADGRPGTEADPLVVAGDGYRVHQSDTSDPSSGYHDPPPPADDDPFPEPEPDDWPTGTPHRRKSDTDPSTETDENPEGDGMPENYDTDLENADTPHEAMQQTFGQFAENARAIATAAGDDLTAAAAVHGYDRDAAVSADIAELHDLAESLAARAEQARTGLAQRHADGAEYHANGQDAHASAFRPS